MAGTAPAPPSPGGVLTTREKLALYVTAGSALGITVLAAIVLIAAKDTGAAARLVFSAVLPLFGTWVGTVLAFYFARDNFTAATASALQTTQNVARLVGGLSDTTPVRDVMLPWEKIDRQQVPSLVDARALPIADLMQTLDGVQRNRLPVVVMPSRQVVCVVHRSTLTDFNANLPARVTAQPTLGDLFDDKARGSLVTAMGFVALTDTIAAARHAVRSRPEANDVFVTETGAPDSPLAGWITNVMLASFNDVR